MYFEEAGKGAPLLFVHGTCGYAGVWNQVVDRLSPRFRCITYDRRGHGRSPPGDADVETVPLDASDAAELLRNLDAGPCIVVGGSAGARVVVEMLRRREAVVKGAVLSEPPFFSLASPSDQSFARELKQKVLAAADADGPHAVDTFFELVAHDQWARLSDEAKAPYRANHVVLIDGMRAQPYSVAPSELRGIATPCSVLRGSNSLPVFRRIAELVAAHLLQAALVEIEESGHMTHLANPESVANAIVALARRSELLGPPAEISGAT